MTELHMNRARRELLAAVGRGKVTLNEAGHPFLRAFRGYNHRCDKDIKAFEAAGWVVLDKGRGAYELTDTGRAQLDGAP